MEVVDLKTLEHPMGKIKVLYCPNEVKGAKWSFMKQKDNLICLLHGSKVTFIKFRQSSTRKKKVSSTCTDDVIDCEIEKEVTLDLQVNAAIIYLFLCGKQRNVGIFASNNSCYIIRDFFWEKNDITSSPVIPMSQLGSQVAHQKELLEIGKIADSASSNAVVLSSDCYIALCCRRKELWKVTVYKVTDRITETTNFFLPLTSSVCPVTVFKWFSLENSGLSAVLSSSVFCFGLNNGAAVWLDGEKLKSKMLTVRMICHMNQPVVAIRKAGCDRLFSFGANGQIVEVYEQDGKLMSASFFFSMSMSSDVCVTATSTILAFNENSLYCHSRNENHDFLKKICSVKGIVSFDVDEHGLYIVTDLKQLHFISNSSFSKVFTSLSLVKMKYANLSECVSKIQEVSDNLQAVSKVLSNQSNMIQNIGIALNILISASDFVNKSFPIEIQAWKKLESATNEKIIMKVHNKSEFDLSSDFWFFKVTVTTALANTNVYVFQLEKDLKASGIYTMWLQMDIRLQSLPIDLNFELVFHVPNECICEVLKLDTVQLNILHFLDEGNVTMLNEVERPGSNSILYDEARVKPPVQSLHKYTTTFAVSDISFVKLLEPSLHQLLNVPMTDKVVVSFLNMQIVFEKSVEQLIVQCNNVDLSIQLKKAVLHRIDEIGDRNKSPAISQDVLLSVQRLRLLFNKCENVSNQLLMTYEDLRHFIGGLQII